MSTAPDFAEEPRRVSAPNVSIRSSGSVPNAADVQVAGIICHPRVRPHLSIGSLTIRLGKNKIKGDFRMHSAYLKESCQLGGRKCKSGASPENLRCGAVRPANGDRTGRCKGSF